MKFLSYRLSIHLYDAANIAIKSERCAYAPEYLEKDFSVDVLSIYNTSTYC